MVYQGISHINRFTRKRAEKQTLHGEAKISHDWLIRAYLHFHACSLQLGRFVQIFYKYETSQNKPIVFFGFHHN